MGHYRVKILQTIRKLYSDQNTPREETMALPPLQLLKFGFKTYQFVPNYEKTRC